MKKWRLKMRFFLCLLSMLAGMPLATPAAFSDELAPVEPLSRPQPGEEWVRFEASADGQSLAMQTAVVRYEGHYAPADRKVIVDLVGAIHIGDAAYYERLNRRFRHYDALLYELVAPEGTIIQPGEKSSTGNPLSAIQMGFKDLLELEHQLEKIDYTAPNFVHADMSPTDFFKSMERRDESVVSMIMQRMGQQIGVQGAGGGASGGEMEMLFALFSTDRTRRLKIAMAKQLAGSASLLSTFGGEEGSTLITERNKVAMEVLKRELLLGRQQVGVFYGAGHLQDMDIRLQQDFGLKPTGVEWLTAWDLSPRPKR